MDIVFWGVGKIGKKMINMCGYYGYKPNYLVDNNSEFWGKQIEGIPVISPQNLFLLKNVKVYVTCKRFNEIKKMLSNNESDHKLYEGSRFFYLLRDNTVLINCIRNFYHIMNRNVCQKRVAFLMENGAVVGGVESWCIQSGEFLWNKNMGVCYLVPSNIPITINIDKKKCVILGEEDYIDGQILGFIDAIINNDFSTIICNFAGDSLDACCVIKALFNNIKLIAVVHNDEDAYYKNYTHASEYIDTCLVISKKTRTGMLNYGFSEKKIIDMEWFIPVSDFYNNRRIDNDKEIAIGYAGRVVKEQKRTDLLLELGRELWSRSIPFKLTVAGDGLYFEEFKQEVSVLPYRDSFQLLGQVDRGEIPGFWLRQDICVSCSEWEGRSISKAEAMAYGAVPIVTDTSGAEDDIDDGINGYIVDVGDIEAMADRIVYLYYHKDVLQAMRMRAQDKIMENNKKVNENEFWEALVE